MSNDDLSTFKVSIALITQHLKSIDEKFERLPICEKEQTKARLSFLTKLVFWMYFFLFSLVISVILGGELRMLLSKIKELSCFTSFLLG